MPTLTTNRIEARAERRQAVNVRRAEASVRAVDKLYHNAWRELHGILASAERPNGATDLRVRALLAQLLDDSIRTIKGELRAVSDESFDQATVDLIKSIPREEWIRLAKRKRGIREGRDPLLTKAFNIAKAVLNSFAELDPDYQALLDGEDLSGEGFGALLKRVLFPPPPKIKVDEILRSDRWPDRKEWPRRLREEGFSFNKIVDQITVGYSQGEGIPDISKRLRPLVDNVRYRATRIARTESMRIGQTMQREAFDKVDDLIVGYKINAVMDERTRPEHAERNGRIYWKAGHGDGGYEIGELPDLPDAPNCRCYATPIFEFDL